MIKNFIYLDEYKMYSLSSQIFEGVTEYLVSTHRNEKEDTEEQKGLFGSGRVLADILRVGSETTEKKYLHDYSYTLFEKYLIDNKKVFSIDGSSTEDDIQSKMLDFSFVRVSGKAVFNDILSIVKAIENLNELGEALVYFENYQSLIHAKEQLSQQISNTKDRNQKSKIQQEKRNLDDSSKKLAVQRGLYHESEFINSLSYILSYGFQDQLQLQISLSNRMFSSDLNRSLLREKEANLIRKYSRKTERNFVVFGIVTQFDGNNEFEMVKKDGIFSHSKEALMNVVYSLTNMERTFTGKLPNEIVIDPIAVYTELL
jgi:hypothetical protein